MKEASPTPTAGSQAAATEQPVQVKGTRDPYLTIRYLICVGGPEAEYPTHDEDARDT